MLDRLASLARQHGDRTAISAEQGTLTFAALHAEATAFAEWLRRADRRLVVVAALPSGPALTAAQIGAWAAGAVFAPIPPRCTEGEAAAYLTALPADVLLVEDAGRASAFHPASRTRPQSWDDWRSAAKPPTAPAAAPPGDGDVRMVQFTSGSTGQPAGIALTSTALRANLERSRPALAGRANNAWCPTPQFHAMGNAAILELLDAGIGVHNTNAFVPAAHLQRLSEHACEMLVAPPSYAAMMLRLGVLARARSLREIVLGSAAVDRALLERLRATLPDTALELRYGLSEAVGALARGHHPAGTPLPAAGAVGTLIAGATLASPLPPPSAPAEELVVRTPTAGCARLVDGDLEPLLDADGALHTGDLACADEDGVLLLRGRGSTFLKVHGHRVGPAEIEAVLRAAPEIHEAVVVGLPDPVGGQLPVACVEPVPGAAPETSALAHWCAEHLSAHKRPKRFVCFARLPRTASGKPDRTAIVAAVQRG